MEPGATPAIRVRGFSSISAGQAPLIIVDGAPYDGGWNNLNPADVASVTVLKDASSTALYGARGANGVIMVTTKHAQAGKAHIAIDMNGVLTVVLNETMKRFLTLLNTMNYIIKHYIIIK